MRRIAALLVPMLCFAGCTGGPGTTEPLPITPAGDAANAAVVRRAVPIPAPADVTAPTAAPALGVQITPPEGTQYVCVTSVAGARQQVAIEFAPKVRELCRKHPEMGPCQYEREACRRSGGRVFEANGTEITRSTEAEYDKRVFRVRFKAN